MSSFDAPSNEYHLFIPVASTDETVAVPVDDLPDEVEDLLDVLRAEEAPLSLWIDFAKAYLAQVWASSFWLASVSAVTVDTKLTAAWCMQGMMKQYLYILNEGTSKEVADYFQGAKFERLQIFCALAAYYTAEGRTQRDRNARADHFAKAAQLLGTARQIDYDDQLPFLGLGQLEMARVRSLRLTLSSLQCTLALPVDLKETHHYLVPQRGIHVACRATCSRQRSILQAQRRPSATAG